MTVCPSITFLIVITPQFVNRIQYSRGLLDSPTENAGNSSALNFQDISIDREFWDYLSTSFPDLMYPLSMSGEGESGNVIRFNKIVQHVRLRQVRVKPQICNIPTRIYQTYSRHPSGANILAKNTTCFPAFSASHEDTSIWNGADYSSAASLGLNSILSSYSMGGFVIAMAKNNSGFKSQIASLRESKWTDGGTRAVFLDFAAYNPGHDDFISVRMLFEFLPYGSIVPQAKIRAFRDNLAHSPSSTITVNLVIEIGLYMSGLANFFRELGKLQAVGINKYFRGIWDMLTLATLLLLLGSVVFRFLVSRQWRQLQNSNPTISQWKIDSRSNSWDIVWDWDFLGYCNGQIVKFQAIALVCAWIRWFGFLKFFNHRIDNFVATMASAKREILTSCVILIMLLMSFAVSFHSGYGEESHFFAAFDTSMLTLCQIMLANFDVGQITASSGLLANALILIFSAVLTFYSANILLSLLWWSAGRVMSGQIERESDDPEENLKYRLIAVLTSWMEKYSLMRKMCSPLLRLLVPTPESHTVGDDKQTAFFVVTAALQRLMRSAKELEHSTCDLEKSFKFGMYITNDAGLQLPYIEMFSVTQVRNRYHRILFTKMLKVVKSQDADMVSDMLIHYKLNQVSASLEWRDAGGNTVLHHASTHGNSEVVQLLLEAGANPNAQNMELNTSLHLAALSGQYDACEVLVYDGNAAVEAKNISKFTPLHIAAYLGHLEIVKLLVEQDDKMISVVNADGFTPLHLAVANNQLDVVEFLIRGWSQRIIAGSQHEDSDTILHFAIRAKSSVETVRLLLQLGCKVGTTGSEGKNIKMLASDLNAGFLIMRLLDRVFAMGDDYDRAMCSLEEGSATSALIEAAQIGDVGEISNLLAEGAHVNGCGVKNTPLHAAVMGKHSEAVSCLLDAKADVNARDVKGYTALQLSVQIGNLADYLLLAEACDELPIDADGNTLLHLATDVHSSPNFDIVKNLIAVLGLNPETPNEFGLSSLVKAQDVLSTLAGSDMHSTHLEAASSSPIRMQATEYAIREQIFQFLQTGKDLLLEQIEHPFSSAVHCLQAANEQDDSALRGSQSSSKSMVGTARQSGKFNECESSNELAMLPRQTAS